MENDPEFQVLPFFEFFGREAVLWGNIILGGGIACRCRQQKKQQERDQFHFMALRGMLRQM